MAQRPLAGGPLATAPASVTSSTAPNGPAGSGTNGAQTAIQSSLASLANLTLRQIVLATMTVLAVTLAFLLLYRFYAVVFLLFVAIAIQIALDPLVRFLAARHQPHRSYVCDLHLVVRCNRGGGLVWRGATRRPGARCVKYTAQLLS